jgi:hypothetical protein
MKTVRDRDLLVLIKHEFMSQQAIEHEVEQLNNILRQTELPHQFCKAHELVQRNSITQKPPRLLAAYRSSLLKPFWFLISRN